MLIIQLQDTAVAGEWGDIKMKFVVNGKIPVAKFFETDKDVVVCSKEKQRVPPIVDADGAIENVVLFLVPPKAAKVKVHPDYEKGKRESVELNIQACRFVPHIAFVRIGQSFNIKNADQVGHNADVQFSSNAMFSRTIPNSIVQTFGADQITKPEKKACPIMCSIHPWMQAWVVVQDHPYMTASDANGVAFIKNMPIGKHRIQIWHESIGYLVEKNTIDESKTPVSWSKGIAELEVHEDENDFGTFKVTLPSF